MSEVLLSIVEKNKDYRFDTDFWTKEPKKNPNLTYVKIGDCLLKSQYGISIAMNEDGKGIPIYRMNEIHNMLCDFSVAKYADVSNLEKETFLLRDRDVLFNRTNSFEWVGRTGIFYKQNNTDFIFASYLVRFVPNENIILPEYLTAYLNTKYGIWDLKRRARQSINQTNINPEEVKETFIPLLDKSIQLKIKDCFDTAKEFLLKSDVLYTEAENLLLTHLGLQDFQAACHSVNIKSFNESFGQTGRLDAEYYQTKYDELENKIKNYQNGFEKLSYFIEDYSTGYPYQSETYTNDGIPLIRINNINSGRLDMSNSICIPKADIDLSVKDIANENDILISMSGTIGNSCVIPKGIKAVINQRIMRITPKNITVEVLPLVLNSLVGKMQLERIGTGGVQTNISASDIKEIFIPKIAPEIQEKIADCIRQSNALREQAQALLSQAKSLVENEIEK